MRPFPKSSGLSRSFSQIPSNLLSHLRRKRSPGAASFGTAPAALPGDMAKTRGNYLLEFAAVLAVMTPIVFGAIDINSALQGYNAVRESADTAARCLYPTDAGCTDASRYGDPRKFYDWLQDTMTASYRPEKSDYAAKSWYRTKPTYTWNTYPVTAFASATFEYLRSYQGFVTRQNVSQGITYNLQTRDIPWVTYSGNADRLDSFAFQSGQNGAAIFTPPVPRAGHPSDAFDHNGSWTSSPTIIPFTTSIPGTGTTGSKIVNHNTSIRVYASLPTNIALPSGNESLKCFKSTDIENPGSGGNAPNTNFSGNCTVKRGNESPNNLIPIGFWLNGYSGGPTHQTDVNLLIELRYSTVVNPGNNDASWTHHSSYNTSDRSFSDNTHLGGQSFTVVGGERKLEPFDPRGFAGRWSGDARGDTSYGLYLYLVPADTKHIRIKVTKATPSEFAVDNYWRMKDDSRLFIPQFQSNSVTAGCTVSCAAGSTTCVPQYQNQTFGPNGTHRTVTNAADANTPANRGQVVLAAAAIETSQRTATGLPAEYSSMDSARAAIGQNDTNGCAISITETIPNPATVKLDCKRDQYGALPGKQANCEFVPPQGSTQVPTNIQSPVWARIFPNAPQTPQERAAFDWNFSWTPENCSSTFSAANFSVPEGLRNRYDDYTPPNSTDSANAALTEQNEVSGLTAVENAPSSTDQRYACFPSKCQFYDALPAGTQAPADCPLAPLDNQTLRTTIFNGLQNRRNSNQEALTAELRTAASTLGMSASRYLEPITTDVVTSNDPSLYAATCPGSNIVCATRFDATQARLVAQNIPEGIVPPPCDTERCYARLSRVDGSTASGVTSKVADAAVVGQQAFAAAFPRANFSCPEGSTAKDCAWVSAAQIGDEVEVTTKLNVPFFFLGTDTRQMTHTQRRKLERSYVQ